jgi:hypothetical protein
VTVADIDMSAYTAVATYDFTTMGDITLTLQEEAAGTGWNAANAANNTIFFCTNEGLENLAVQVAYTEDSNNRGWSVVDGKGLYLAPGAGRCAAIAGVKTGMIVEFTYTGSGFYTKGNADCIATTAISEGIGNAMFMAEADGMMSFEIEKGNYVERITLYSDGTVDAIQTVNTQTEGSAIFNLAGQRVMNAQKGLFIQNGKKFIK